MLFSNVFLIAALASTSYASPMLSKRCDVKGCALALGPTALDCGGAAIQEGVDPVNDATCVAQAAGTVASPPSECSGCVSDAVNDVEGAITSIGNTLGSIF